MKKSAIQELQRKPAVELLKELGELRARFATLQTDLERGKVKNVREIRSVKKDIARHLTLLNAPPAAKA